MSKPIESLLASFKDSTDLTEVHDTYTHMSLPPSRHMRKSQVADYFANHKLSGLSLGRSTPAICLHRLPAAGVPTQIAELVRVRNNAVQLEHINADPLWLARRVLGQEMFLSPNYCFRFDTYYLCEEGTASITVGAKKLTAEERKKADEDENALAVHEYMPAMEILRGHGDFKFLVVPAYTVHALMLQSDALLTVGHIVPKSENGADDHDYSTVDYSLGMRN
ncbi:hypothetical protein E8E12_005468 [Didymella heteroderae]|uniref:Uncharacterized protein n=1 Tax=Didymella heteroderae TaxID=1769908 RepID=A0A9P4WXP3_9PLEO|nr:hypothetical protein E8E12_005468 [Didymella heteroderae]